MSQRSPTSTVAIDRLPRESALQTTGLRVAGLLGSFAIVLAGLNVAARAALDEWTTNRGYWLVNEKWDLLESLDEPVDWLVLGDSSGNQAVVPELLEESFGGDAVNLCVVADLLAANDAWMLEHHISTVGPPENVLIVHVYDIWHRGARFLTNRPWLSKVPLPHGFWETSHPPVHVKDKDARQLWMARYLPLWSENRTLASWLLNPANVLERTFELEPSGFMPLDEPNPKNVRKDVREHAAFTRKNKFRMSPLNGAALERVQQLAEDYDFDVWIAVSPVAESAWKRPPIRAYIRDTIRALRQFTDRSERLHLVFEEPVRFPESQMENVDHVISEAATEYTLRVVSAIRELRSHE